jgi:16S rRNA C967 or C1407 C5-methylase (RsmB/RsmF family)
LAATAALPQRDRRAAPGIKTSHMAQSVYNQGIIVANEPVRYRLFMLEYNPKRLGISNGVAIHYTDQNFPLWCKFTRVLVDSRAQGRGIIAMICRDAYSMCVVPLACRMTCRACKSNY